MQQSSRDNFSVDTKRQLAASVGSACSICGQATHGPNDNFTGSVNNGIAAHICAAAPGGPRYDASMSVEERKSFSNGIWVCPNHASLIDKQPLSFTVEQLKQYKRIAMEAQQQKLFNMVSSVCINHHDRDYAVLVKYAEILPYSYIQQLLQEPFGARVPHTITDPLNHIDNVIDNPEYIFVNPTLDNLRIDLKLAIRDFWIHFGANCAGMIGYYDYINIPQFKMRNPSIDESYWEDRIYETQRLAKVICDLAYLILLKKEGLR